MYVSEKDITRMDELYGPARRITFDPIPMLDFEYALLVSSMERGRAHDVTMFIARDGGWVGIQKPAYGNTGIFRAPSGGLAPGETLEQGVTREMLEETGLVVEVDGFLLIIKTEFIGPGGDMKPWTSYVFSGRDGGGDIEPKDVREISAARLLTRDEMLGPIAREMEQSGWGGFRYRVMLTRAAFDAIDSRKMNV